jgi:hypothetical protein
MPQAFLIKNGKNGTKYRFYIGQYQNLQYLEDCDLLDKLLTGDLCPHFRIYNSLPYFPQAKLTLKSPPACLKCTNNLPSILPMTLSTNYHSSTNTDSHLLCLFFERNYLPYTLI